MDVPAGTDQLALTVILVVIPLAVTARLTPDQPDAAKDLSCNDGQSGT
jgi:hypothetical protein